MEDQESFKKQKTIEDIIADKKKKLEKAKAALRAVERAADKRARKERDTAIFTAGACMLAALESDDAATRDAVADLWCLLREKHAPLITDYRRQCLEKTAFKDVR